MSRRERITKELIVEPGTEANIAGRDPAWTGGPEFEQLSERQLSHTAKALLANGVEELAKAQELLWASDTNALLVVFQALDAAGQERGDDRAYIDFPTHLAASLQAGRGYAAAGVDVRSARRRRRGSAPAPQ